MVSPIDSRASTTSESDHAGFTGRVAPAGRRTRAPQRRAAATGEVAEPAVYVAALDGVRALAVSSVFLLHLDRARFPGGWVGVDVFFALSAYLITGMIIREHGRGPVRFGASTAGEFFGSCPLYCSGSS